MATTGKSTLMEQARRMTGAINTAHAAAVPNDVPGFRINRGIWVNRHWGKYSNCDAIASDLDQHAYWAQRFLEEAVECAATGQILNCPQAGGMSAWELYFSAQAEALAAREAAGELARCLATRAVGL